ncbi:MAG: hypothetical protein FWB93_04805, partial [Oscillospiraceae bacterium]|nr:hypothetical protein [Oscillospiraceae bacterium]
MAIVKMDKISVIGLSTQRADVLSELQKIGRMEIVAPEKDKELQFVDNGAIIAELDGQMAQLERAIEALQTHVPQKGGMLSTRRQVTGEELGAIVTRREELLSQAGAII